jgi:hypothetical protein
MGQGFDVTYTPNKNNIEYYAKRMLAYKKLGAFIETI